MGWIGDITSHDMLGWDNRGDSVVDMTGYDGLEGDVRGQTVMGDS